MRVDRDNRIHIAGLLLSLRKAGPTRVDRLNDRDPSSRISHDRKDLLLETGIPNDMTSVIES